MATPSTSPGLPEEAQALVVERARLRAVAGVARHVAALVDGPGRARAVPALLEDRAALFVQAAGLGEVAGGVGHAAQVVEAARHVVGVAHAARLAEHRLQMRARRGEVAHELAGHGQRVERHQRGALVAQLAVQGHAFGEQGPGGGAVALLAGEEAGGIQRLGARRADGPRRARAPP